MFDITSLASGQVKIVSGNSMQSQWTALLRRGIGVEFDRVVSVKSFMTDVLGMDESYATEKVPGLFLNNAPVDDWTTEMVCAGDELGMSGTMPGMVGIALRRSSPIKSFRADLHSHHDAAVLGGGVAVVKMFNFIAKDCGAPVLQHGVRVSGQNLLSYMDEHEISLDECTCYWNEDQIEGKAMRGALAGVSSDIVLSVITG